MVHQGFSLNKLLSYFPGRLARFLMLALGGALTALTVACPSLGALEWIALIPAAVAILGIMSDGTVKLRHAYGYGLFFFMSYYCVIYHWFVTLYPLEFTGMSRGAAVVVVIAGWFGLSLLQSLSGGLVFVALTLLGRLGIVKRAPLLKVALAAAMWGIFEWSQTFFWFGVPWGRLGIGQSELLLMLRPSAFLGPYFVTFVIVAVNFTLALCLLERKKIKLYSVCAVGLLVCHLALGVASTLLYTPTENDGFVAAAIQGNISSSEKWDMSPDDILDVYEQLTLEAADEGAELIIWPETAVPIDMNHNPARIARIKGIASSSGCDILVGLFTSDDNGMDRNSLVLFRKDGSIGEQIYSKRHLVPFGEYVPMRKVIETLIPPLTEIAMLEEDIAVGEDSGLIDWNGISLGSLICFDSIYERASLQSVRDGADIIILSTNDSWFFDSAAVYMHNAQAVMRAVENGRYVVRAASTGVSSVITPRGEVINMLDALTTGYIVQRVAPVNARTLYSYIGNAWVYLMMTFVLGVGVVGGVKNNKFLRNL